MSAQGKAIEAVRRTVADRHASQVRFLAALVQAPSDNPPGDCAPHAERAARLLGELGFAVERDPVPAEAARSVGMTSATNLVVRERFGAGPVIALNAHGDVVPPGLGWSVDPYGAVIRDGVMYGRGVAVSKSDFATYAFALLALKEAASASALRLAGTVELHFTYDEEAGGEIGPKRLLDTGQSKPDYAICAGFSYGITTAHNGCLHLEVEVTGRSAHAARPDTGVDALEASTAILADLYAWRKTLAATRSKVPGIESPTLVVGLISGGINTNVVPDRVAFRIDRRIVPEEDPAAAERELVARISSSAAKHSGIECRIRRILLAKPLAPLPGQERLVGALQRHAREVLGEAIETHGVPIYTDARHYGEAGIPVVLYGAGPRTLLEANGHRADERLRLEDLRKATEVVACALVELLSPAT
ncbi:MAG: ArgE/DapE family deacylase [Betaproteobacteria bacterium]|nr:ArgE/DapE family deacylase [Betaproteobacteria bacterium]